MNDDRFRLEAILESSADTGGFTEAAIAAQSLSERLDALDRRSARLDIRIADTSVWRDLTVLDRLLSRFDGRKVAIDVDVNTTGAIAKLGLIETVRRTLDKRDIDIDVDVNTAGATAKLGGLVATSAAARAALAALAGAGSILGIAFTSVNPYAVIGALVVLTAVAAPLIAALGLLLAAVTPLVGILGVAAAAAGIFAGGFALAAAPIALVVRRITSLRENSRRLPPHLQRVVDAFKRLKENAKDLFGGSEKEAAGLITRLLNLANRALPTVARASEGAFRGLAAGIDSVLEKVSPTERNSLTRILDAIPGIVRRGTDAVGTFALGFLNFTGKAVPDVKDLSRWISDVADGFLKWTRSDKGREQLALWFRRGRELAKALVDVLRDIVPPLFAIGEKHGPKVAETIRAIGHWIGHSLIPFLDDFLKQAGRFVDWLLDVRRKWDREATLLIRIAKDLMEGSVDIFVGGVKVIRGVMETLFGVLTGDWELAATGVKRIVEGLWQMIRGAFKLGTAFIKNVGESIYDAITHPFRRAKNDVVDNSIVPDMANDVEAVIAGLPARLNRHGGGIEEAIVAPWRRAAQAQQAIRDGLGRDLPDARHRNSMTDPNRGRPGYVRAEDGSWVPDKFYSGSDRPKHPGRPPSGPGTGGYGGHGGHGGAPAPSMAGGSRGGINAGEMENLMDRVMQRATKESARETARLIKAGVVAGVGSREVIKVLDGIIGSDWEHRNEATGDRR